MSGPWVCLTAPGFVLATVHWNVAWTHDLEQPVSMVHYCSVSKVWHYLYLSAD